MIIKLILAFAAAMLVTAIVGKFLIPYLRAIKAGQSIREDGPVWHMSKQGTPTMGGLMFIGGTLLAVLLVGIPEILGGEFLHLFLLLFALIYGAIGFLDDFEKLKKKQNLGLTALQKFLLQTVVAVAFILLLRLLGYLKPNLYVPFFDVTWILPDWLYFVLCTFIIVGCVNAVNITDGVDGLVTGVSIPVLLFFAAVAFVWGYAAQGIFAAALAGGLAAFLIFNFHPAKIFMGDTGSLFLGASICALAFAMDMPLILIPVGIIYVLETLSDIIQVAYFKLSHGKRIFKMAPLHHHLEMCGWSEKKLFFVFTGITLVVCVVCFIFVRGRLQV